MLYNKFSDYLKQRYGTKVYKLPVNLPVTCPNRDGCLGNEGCAFCGEEGAGFENLPNTLSVNEQIKRNAEYISQQYGVNKYIVYFQNYSNTYMPFETFSGYMQQACVDDVLALYISTRPDCISLPYMEFLKALKEQKGVDIVLELGLQTVNYKTLKKLSRGHLLAEFIDSVLNARRYDLEVCAHYIVDLPMDDMEDVVEGARVLSALGIQQVKCHSMFILEGTQLGEMYKRKEISPVSLEEYMERVICFLEYLSPSTVVQRLLGRAPEERTLFCNWGMSWWKIRDLVEAKMISEGRCQGAKCDYLNGQRCMGKFY